MPVSKIQQPKKPLKRATGVNAVKKKPSTSKTPAEKVPQKPVKKESNAVNSPANISKLIESLNKTYGENAVCLGVALKSEVQRIPTGSLILNEALGGGIPVGRVTEISGGFSSTKTTQCAHIIANAQKMGFVCALLDIENTSTPDYLEQCGVDTSTLIYSNPSGMEEAMSLVHSLQKSNVVNLIVLDSWASMAPTKEVDADMDETVRLGIQSQSASRFYRVLQMNNNKLTREGLIPVTLLVINQLREKIGAYGDPEYTPGGKGKDYYYSVCVRFRTGDWITEGSGENKHVTGQVVKFKVSKNKLGNRISTGSFDFYYGENNIGVEPLHNDTFKELILLCVEYGIIERSSSWFVYKGTKFQGIPKLYEGLKTIDGLSEELLEQVHEIQRKRANHEV